MANYRRDRINDEVMKEMNVILRTVKDPRVSDAFVSVTSVEVSGDLKFAKVWYSFLYGDEKEVKRGLVAAAKYIRGQLARSLNLRITPELMFARDNSIEHGAHISEVLSRLKYSDDPKPEENTPESQSPADEDGEN